MRLSPHLTEKHTLPSSNSSPGLVKATHHIVIVVESSKRCKTHICDVPRQPHVSIISLGH